MDKNLSKYFNDFRAECIHAALTGTKTRFEIEAEKREQRVRELWNITLFKAKKCAHCGGHANIISNIDCGIDCGPSPVTMRGIKIICQNKCGMKTDTMSYYPGDVYQLALLRKAVREWNGFHMSNNTTIR